MNDTQPSPTASKALDDLCINTIRFLSADAVQNANSGHPGLPMGAASLAYTLWTDFLRHNPANPSWFNRDRFVLSAGHGSMLLYSLLHLTGYDLSLEEIRQFRQWRSRTPGHPERGHTPGVETTTGPLGQGFGNAVGMAIAEAHLGACYNRPGFEVVNHYTYCLVGDGDLMEGVSAEAVSLAGHLRLGKLICLYDDNRISLAGSTSLAFTEDCGKRFAACGWQVLRVEDATDLTAIRMALAVARGEREQPSLIMVRTRIGYGAPHKQDSFEAHGSPLGDDELKLAKKRLGWPVEPLFHLPGEAVAHFRTAVDRGNGAEAEWHSLFSRYEREFPEPAAELKRVISGRLPEGWDADVPVFPSDAKGMATRVASGRVMNAIASNVPELVGGSADLNPSTFTMLDGAGDFQSPGFLPSDRQGAVGGEWGYGGRNLHFGVREHAMGAIMNGIAVHGGLIPFGSTFLVFSDYLRPSIRLSALMGLRLVHIFTHDSIAVGEDGPTHQPVEQLASLRAIPGLVVIRPADANETAVAWQAALAMESAPVALILSRQNLPILDRALYRSAEGVRRGAYILSDPPQGVPQLILVASGSEVNLIVAAGKLLTEQGVRVRLVSMPSWELFDGQPASYRDELFPPLVRARLAVECGSIQGWHRYVGDGGDVIGIDRFGASAPGPVVTAEYGFTPELVCQRALALVNRGGEVPQAGG